MSSLESIQKWLENPLDYFSGVLLFSKYCKNKNLLANLQRSETDYNSEKLKYELDKKVINVESLTSLASETAIEILETVPSITVDIDGNVSLRGNSNFSLLIDKLEVGF